MSARAVGVAVLTAVLVGLGLSRLALLLPIITIPVGCVVGGAVLAVWGRPVDWGQALFGGGLVAVAVTFTTIMSFTATGASPLEGRYLISWILCLLVGGAAAAAVARLGGQRVDRAQV
ncbi:hypothetical protein [Knoellia subterranea]|uniref:Uncharacterized protein n=1 Tax=Knoellia subterranea KCTC 19937 TaxID=1385521 RepID=A0A0A0JKG0_9MICO|nr:hypothetical protein [Knoellia subterranea]KGN37568.1 hypothetical protein N803_13550 [Knoellia subterranea KCTC 19937]